MKKYSIMIIEDNPITRKMLRLTLQAQGYETLEAESGSAALALMKSTYPDMILQDMLLPDMSGIELNHALRTLDNGKNIPILAISGFLARLEELNERYDGFTGYIIKPISPATLLSIISQYLPQHPSTTQPAVPIKSCALVVDDDANHLRTLSFYLKKAGFEIIEATNGQEAINQAIIKKPDVIISDVLMPIMDGFQLCYHVRQDQMLSDVPVILLSSSYIEHEDSELAKNCGATAYIEKGQNYPELIAKICNIMGDNTKINKIDAGLHFKAEHTSRLQRQLEIQYAEKVQLARMNAMQSAQLALLKNLSDALSSQKDLNSLLNNILSVCLDAAGISTGLLYLIDYRTGMLTLKSQVGYPQSAMPKLGDFFGEIEALTQLMDKQHVMELPSNLVNPELSKEILNLSDVKSALIVPLISIDGTKGVLFLGNRNDGSLVSDINFASVLGTHIVHTVSMAETFNNLSISENRYRTLLESVTFAIILHDENGIIVEANKHSEELFLKNRDRLIGSDFNDLIESNDKQRIKEQFTALIGKKNVYTGRCNIKNNDGVVLGVNISISYIKINDENMFLTVLNDLPGASANKAIS